MFFKLKIIKLEVNSFPVFCKQHKKYTYRSISKSFFQILKTINNTIKKVNL
ncbi:hypothetical protein RCH33_1370 [Flavobacterium daejeonense]|nr:hypothetical protein RCH33_1370 [Flavobacterium daejeonense]